MTKTIDKYLERIVVDPRILVGKPVVRGTRIPVQLVLEHLANSLDLDDLFAAFPRLTVDDVKACLAYAQAMIAGEDVFPVFVTEAESASPG
jgi:uncharacterized protein (DUF433 family)